MVGGATHPLDVGCLTLLTEAEVATAAAAVAPGGGGGGGDGPSTSESSGGRYFANVVSVGVGAAGAALVSRYRRFWPFCESLGGLLIPVCLLLSPQPQIYSFT